jgi:3-oxoacyl-(acyl-carrier-protein) synthase
MKKKRVVITGLGAVSPNGIGLADFLDGLREGRSGIRYFQNLKDLGFSCCIAGQPEVTEEMKLKYLSPLQLRNFNSSGILYGCMAGIDAWKDAGLKIEPEGPVDFESGTVFGTGTSGVDKFREGIYLVDQGKVRRLGSTTVAQTMASGVSAYLSGVLGLGNQVTTNSSACATGTEAVLLGYERIRNGKASKMLVGSCSDHGPYLWSGFDAMRVLTYKHNESPELGSRPMSLTASGFVPGSGAGALLLEDLDSALKRGARIYAEVLGGHVNSGGQRQGGTMTAPNSEAVQRCIREALLNAKVHPGEIDVINGHLTATAKDPTEIRNWREALGRTKDDFPYINSLKSMTGHGLAASGSLECVSSVLEVYHDFVYPSINSEDLHPEIEQEINPERVPQKIIQTRVNVIAKASFGFGDVNACVLFKKFEKETEESKKSIS